MQSGVTQTDQFVFFWDGWPSQWFRAPFVIDGLAYNCCEQFMMAEKARVFGDHENLQLILRATSPREQKSLGRRVRGFDHVAWNGVCRGVVYRANLFKFSQNARLARVLLDTGSRTIVEASPEDCIWGIGLAADDPRARDPARWRGTNWLGVAIMQVRETLRRQSQGLDPLIDDELRAQLARRATQGAADAGEGGASC